MFKSRKKRKKFCGWLGMIAFLISTNAQQIPQRSIIHK